MAGAKLALLAVVLCSGCSRTEIQPTGSVTFNGAPLENGSIEFVPIDGTRGGSASTEITAGRYTCPQNSGLVEGGRYLVRITAMKKTGKKAPSPMRDGPRMVDVMENFIPTIFNSDSTLTVVIATEQTNNTYDFPLEFQKK